MARDTARGNAAIANEEDDGRNLCPSDRLQDTQEYSNVVDELNALKMHNPNLPDVYSNLAVGCLNSCAILLNNGPGIINGEPDVFRDGGEGNARYCCKARPGCAATNHWSIRHHEFIGICRLSLRMRYLMYLLFILVSVGNTHCQSTGEKSHQKFFFRVKNLASVTQCQYRIL